MVERRLKYLLKFHRYYFEKVDTLKDEIRRLKGTLDHDAFLQHPDVKFTCRLKQATEKVIPENPDKVEYRLRNELKKYRRYKQGLQRYRLFFTFSSKPPLILYLYLNDKSTLRKDGDRNDPYKIFSKMVKKGEVSHNPHDPAVQKWIRDQTDITQTVG